MAAEGTIRINVDFDPEREVDDAVTKMRKLSRAVKRADRQTRDMAKSGKKLAKAQKQVGRSAFDAKKGLDLFKKQGEVIQGNLGGIISRLGGVGESLMLLGPQGAAIGAAVAGFAAAGLAIGAVGVAIFKMVLKADDLIAKMREMGREVPISAEQEDAIARANAAWDEIGHTLDRVAVVIAGRFAPVVEEIVILMDAWFRASEKIIRSYNNTGNVLQDVALAFTTAATAGEDFLATSRRLADENANAALAQQIATEHARKALDVVAKQERARRDQIKQQKAWIRHLEREQQVRRNLVDLDAERAAEAVELAIRVRQVREAEAEAATKAAIEAAAMQEADDIERHIRNVDRREKEAEAVEKLATTRRDAAIDAAVQISGIVADSLAKDAEGRKKAAVFESIVAGLAGVVKAAPDPFLMAAIGAIATANTTAIASTPVPEFPFGGTPDHNIVAVQDAERIVDGHNARRFASELDDISKGRDPGSSRPMIIEQRYGHRTFNAVVEDNAKMTSSPLRKAIRGSKRAGHRGRS